MSVVAPNAIPDHLDFLVMQPDEESAVVRDLLFAVHAFNAQGRGDPLQVSFPLYTDAKVDARGVLGPCVRITGPAEKLYVLTLRYEISAHLRAGRAMTLVRDGAVVEAHRNERFDLLASGATIARPRTRPLVLSGNARLIETAGALGAAIDHEAVFVTRAEAVRPVDGAVDLLGFSRARTLPVLR